MSPLTRGIAIALSLFLLIVGYAVVWTSVDLPAVRWGLTLGITVFAAFGYWYVVVKP